MEFEIRSRRDIVYSGDQDAALESNVFARDDLPDVPGAEPVVGPTAARGQHRALRRVLRLPRLEAARVPRLDGVRRLPTATTR
ncbi:hypothetical protein AB0M83_21065 [Amycolatopsis sp. NPDC051106]|uniref:hypothetical protein n=1 Tax=unclassified Amycolatopsis TaxID=2618356 RepID=UPI0034290E17